MSRSRAVALSKDSDEEAQNSTKDEKSETSSANSVRKVFKRKPSRARLRGALEPFLERWITTTFRAHTTEPNACANEIFAPIPTLCALYAVTQALPKSKCGSVRDLFEFNVECLHELRSRIASQLRLPPSTVFSFLKIIVDDDEKTLVSDSFMRKMKELFTDEVVLACSPQKVARFLRSLTGGAIDGPRSVYGLTSFYATAGLKARWCGKAVAVNPSAFASTYSLRQKHPFIQVETDAKKIDAHNCEIWELPLKAGTVQFHLCLIRPRFLGDILKLKTQMLGQNLKDILDELLRTKSQHCKLLLPVFSLKCEENLERIWMKHGTGNMGEDAVLPPFHAIWNVTKLSISLEGVNTRDLKLAPNPRLPPSYRSYYTSDDLWQPHPAPGTSIDSSFLFVITQRGSIPLLAGCYAGHPPPPNAAFTLLAPNRIRSKPPPKIDPRPKVKLTKKQKKALKVCRQRAAEIKSVELPTSVNSGHYILEHLNPL